MPKKTMYRSARTGKVVSKAFAEKHKATTVKERRKVKRRRKAKPVDPADLPLFNEPRR